MGSQDWGSLVTGSIYIEMWDLLPLRYVVTCTPVLKDHIPLAEGPTIEELLPGYLVLYDIWHLMAVVSQDRFTEYTGRYINFKTDVQNKSYLCFETTCSARKTWS